MGPWGETRQSSAGKLLYLGNKDKVIIKHEIRRRQMALFLTVRSTGLEALRVGRCAAAVNRWRESR